MSIDVTTEKRFESDIEEFFLSPAGGYTHNQDAYDPQLGVYKDTLLRFVQKTQPKEWKHFLLQNKVDTERKFCLAFNNACDMDGLISVLRHDGYYTKVYSFANQRRKETIAGWNRAGYEKENTNIPKVSSVGCGA